ncbi:MAG: peptide chain release factor N(5)-glutamine methyltransferase [Nocardioidaceae bacterium]|nr:peptide chain release factor N(5)-glutamine methyltransferase [Nocardioidaceae bacterium]
MTATRTLLHEAAHRLRAAGVASPEYDAAELLAWVLGSTRAELALIQTVQVRHHAAFEALLVRRLSREPLQHLTGVAGFRYVEVAVGPGVFIPRPETELLAGWAIEAARACHAATGQWPTVVDLCTGSGAIAKAIKDEVPLAAVHACELSPEAFVWAEQNLAGTGVDLREEDLATAFEDLLAEVDVLVSNPPYVPLEAWESVAPEARDHDPHLALFAGADGLDAIRVLEQRAAVLLKPGAVVGVEHADEQGEVAPAIFSQAGRWEAVVDHRDLNGRPRFLTARRPQQVGPSVGESRS